MHKNIKTLYLIRGLPGSGKTTLARELATSPRGANHGSMHAADDFFYNEDGDYDFRPDLLPMAHQECIDATEADMAKGYSNIAVHNTFSQRWEAEPYYELASKYGYQAVIIECQNNFGSVHEVPEHAITAMADRWETLGPVKRCFGQIHKDDIGTAFRAGEEEEEKVKTDDDILHESICTETCEHHNHKCPHGFECEPHEDLDKAQTFEEWIDSPEIRKEGEMWGELADQYHQELDEELNELLTNDGMLEQAKDWCGGEDGGTSWEDHLQGLLSEHKARTMSELRDREAQSENLVTLVRAINKRIMKIHNIQTGE